MSDLTTNDEVYQEYLDRFSFTCTSDFPSIGYQPGEKICTMVRVLCTLITVSIISSWCNKRIVERYLLFFTHWLSGLLHQLAQVILADMVLLCWTQSNALRFVQAMKFVELVAGNMQAVTNLAICVNLALVVSSHRTMARVKSVTSPRLILGFLGISIVAALAGSIYWESLTLSGTLFWSTNMDKDKHRWVLTSIFYMELISGFAMIVIGSLLVTLRWPELCQVWRLHRRIKCYIALSMIATLVDLAIGVGGVVYLVTSWEILIVLSWTMRHIHIALDTIVLYSALGVTTSYDSPTSITNEDQSGDSPALPRVAAEAGVGNNARRCHDVVDDHRRHHHQHHADPGCKPSAIAGTLGSNREGGGSGPLGPYPEHLSVDVPKASV
ncbi:unnamed protein product [Scytosiphon promiscuus]